MDDELVIVSTSDAVRTIRLNRPSARNALSPALRAAFVTALREAGDDDQVRCVVLRGDDRAFCAGGDIKSMDTEEAPLATVRRLDQVSEMVRTLYGLPKPTIAAVEGAAVGAGLSIALSADIMVATEHATFSAAFVRRGLVPDTGLTYLLARSVGLARAKYLVMTAETFGAERAEAMGLIAARWSSSEFEARLGALSGELAAGPTGALALSKQLLNHAFDIDLDVTLSNEALGQAVARSTVDHRESVRSFKAKDGNSFVGH